LSAKAMSALYHCSNDVLTKNKRAAKIVIEFSSNQLFALRKS